MVQNKLRGNFRKILADTLGNSINEDEKQYLPRGYQQVGHVVILNLRNELLDKKKIIAEAILKIVKNCSTVCLKKGAIYGEFREPQLELLAGSDTETIVIENGIKYKFDVLKIMFAKGNINERRRYIPLIKNREIIFDFYAGIGYFTLGIAKFSKASRIYAFEINPTSYKYLIENLKLNKIPKDKVIPIFGDCRIKALEIPEHADRIIMGILPSPKSSLDTAFKVLKKGPCVIHYEGILLDNNSPETLLSDVENVAVKNNRTIELAHLEKIKSYKPHTFHVCLDINVY
ncbi:MAG: class I SAM-dependent methyltransferase [Candidatus Helarchaeota archaeon]